MWELRGQHGENCCWVGPCDDRSKLNKPSSNPLAPSAPPCAQKKHQTGKCWHPQQKLAKHAQTSCYILLKARCPKALFDCRLIDLGRAPLSQR